MKPRIASVAVTTVLVAGAGIAAGGCGSSASSSNTVKTSPSSAPSFSGVDEQYLMTSAEGDAFEITGGKIALRKSQNPKVQKLAHRLIRDHSKSLTESRSLAGKLGVKVEDKPSPPESWELKVVSTKTGTDFDHWYADLEVQDHMQDITDTSFEIQHGQNPEVLASAKKELPELKMHLQVAKAALK